MRQKWRGNVTVPGQIEESIVEFNLRTFCQITGKMFRDELCKVSTNLLSRYGYQHSVGGKYHIQQGQVISLQEKLLFLREYGVNHEKKILKWTDQRVNLRKEDLCPFRPVTVPVLRKGFAFTWRKTLALSLLQYQIEWKLKRFVYFFSANSARLTDFFSLWERTEKFACCLKTIFRIWVALQTAEDVLTARFFFVSVCA